MDLENEERTRQKDDESRKKQKGNDHPDYHLNHKNNNEPPDPSGTNLSSTSISTVIHSTASTSTKSGPNTQPSNSGNQSQSSELWDNIKSFFGIEKKVYKQEDNQQGRQASKIQGAKIPAKEIELTATFSQAKKTVVENVQDEASKAGIDTGIRKMSDIEVERKEIETIKKVISIPPVELAKAINLGQSLKPLGYGVIID